MLDYVQSLYCAFDSSSTNRAALITFAQAIVVQIPLAQFTTDAWFAAVENVRAQQICCSCCTPTATAIDAAASLIQNNYPTAGTIPITFMITDGQPYQK